MENPVLRQRGFIAPPTRSGAGVHWTPTDGWVDEHDSSPLIKDIVLSANYESVLSTTHQGPPYITGGPFALKRFSINRTCPEVEKIFSLIEKSSGKLVQRRGFSGKVMIDDSTFIDGLPLILDPSYAKMRHDSLSFPNRDLVTYGPKVLTLSNPLNNKASIAQFFGELLADGLPNIPLIRSHSKRAAKNLGSRAGDEFLNVKFGWEPLLGDLRRIYNTWQTLDRRIGQIIRDNNKAVRRNGDLVDSSDTTTVYSNGPGYLLPNTAIGGGFRSNYFVRDNSVPFNPTTGYRRLRTQTIEKVWYSSRVKYYIPDLSESQWNASIVSKLFGANPSPSTLYELMPWSWLIDWFLNVGDVIKAFSQSVEDNLVVDYSYIMRHKKVVSTYEACSLPLRDTVNTSFYRPDDTFIAPLLFTSVLTEETKERVASTIFGFGLTFSDLSDQQKAILTALGLSRSRYRDARLGLLP